MADKKISELPIVLDNIYKLSDSDVVAMVSASTTAQITIKTLRDKMTEFAAKTGSANTFTGNQYIAGNVTITGKLNVNDIETVYQTSSVVFSSGSNKFGDQASDKHEFTGSVDMVGSLLVNGESLNIASLNNFSSSQLGVNVGVSIVTASFNAFSSSQLGVNVGNSIVTASFNAFSSSQLGINVGVSIVTASFNSFSSSQLGVNAGVSIVTASINNFTSSQLGVNVGVSIVTASINNFTSSQLEVNIGNSIVTASLNDFTSSQLGVNVGNSIVTASLNAHSRSISERVADIQFYTASVKVEIGQLLSYTASLNAFTTSQNIDVTNIQAYTASVKVELSQLFAYTASVKETITQTLAYTASVKNEIGQIVAYTSSLNSYTQSVKNEVANIQAYTASVKNEIGQIVAYTSSLNSYTQSAKIDVANIQSYTASVKETVSQTLSYTASVKNEVANIQAYTSSLKTAIVVSGIDVEVLGKFKAKEIYTSYVTSSVLYQSGSTKFGDTIDDKHESTGSVVISGSLVLNGFDLGNSNSQIISYTSSVKNEVANIQAYTSSVKYELGQVFAYTASVKEEIGQLVSYTSSLNVFTASAKLDIAGLQSYSHSLKSVALVSGSQQVVNYNLFALTASANTFYGTQTIQGNLHLSSTSPLLYNASNTNAMLFGFFDGSSIYGPYYQIFGSNYSNVSQRGSAEFVFDSRNGGFSGFNVAEFNGSTWLRKFRVSPYGAEVTGSLTVTEQISSVGITSSILATNSVLSGSQQVLDYNLFALTASNNTHYGENTFTNKVTHTNGFVILQQVSQSLNFVDDAAAAAGGVPLGGLYRNGNFVVIRIS